MRAVADALRFQHGGEDRALPEPPGDRAAHFPHDHRLVGSAKPLGWCHRHLELARAVFGQEGIRQYAGLANGGDEGFGKTALAPQHVQRVAGAGTVLDAGIDELLFEGGADGEARALPQCRQCAAQKMARAALPVLALRRQDVAEIEPLGGIGERHLDARGRIGNQHQVAFGAERRVVDRPERRHHDVAVREADAALQPRGQLGRRKPFPPHQTGEVAGADKNQILTLHRLRSGVRPRLYI